MVKLLPINQASNTQKTLHTSPVRARYGVSFVSIFGENYRVMKRPHCIWSELYLHWCLSQPMYVEDENAERHGYGRENHNDRQVYTCSTQYFQSHSHNEDETKWTPFCRWFFQMNFFLMKPIEFQTKCLWNIFVWVYLKISLVHVININQRWFTTLIHICLRMTKKLFELYIGLLSK